MSKLEIRNLTGLESPRRKAAEDVSLTLGDGERLALLGPKFSGKASLLRLVCGLDVPSSGSILLDGDDITARPGRERPIALLSARHVLYPHLTVYGNLTRGLGFRTIPLVERDRRARRVARFLDLQTQLDRKPVLLSGEENSRLALGRVLVRRPEVLLCDCPFLHLDDVTRKMMTGWLDLAATSQKFSLLYATRDPEEAERVTDNILIMEAGSLRSATYQKSKRQGP